MGCYGNRKIVGIHWKMWCRPFYWAETTINELPYSAKSTTAFATWHASCDAVCIIFSLVTHIFGISSLDLPLNAVWISVAGSRLRQVSLSCLQQAYEAKEPQRLSEVGQRRIWTFALRQVRSDLNLSACNTFIFYLIVYECNADMW